MFESIIGRRDFLRAGGAGLLGLGAAQALAAPACAQAPAGKAKAVILVYLAGGLSQTESFDPKPENGKDNGPRYYKTIPTNVPGIEVSEGVPMLARLADKYSILRSMTHPAAALHGQANYIVTTGTLQSKELVYPTVGSVVAFKRGDPQSVVPPYVFLTDQRFQFTEAGFLGPEYAPYATGGDPSWPNFNAGLCLPAGVTPQRAQQSATLLAALDALGGKSPSDEELRRIADYRGKAFKLILEEGQKAFDLSSEKKELRQRYGMNWFGQSALLARKLVAAANGVKFVKIFWIRGSGAFGGWDTHSGDSYQATLNNQPDLDQGLSALLEDLSRCGLLESTIVLAGGEMGRDPRLADPRGGRKHHAAGFTWLVAGGGFQGGKVVGKTDNLCRVIERPVYPWDLWASVYKLLGIDTRDVLPHPQGCGRARVLPPPPTGRQLAAIQDDNLESGKGDGNIQSLKPFPKTDEPISGGLLTEIM